MSDKRRYLKTHTWLTFGLNLSKMDFNFWFLLGAAQSKCRHISGVPMKPDFAQKLYQVSLAKGALATTAIEGNTLSLEEVEARIKKESSLPKSREYLGIEIDNIINAFNYVANTEIDSGKDKKLSVEEIKRYNSMVLKNVDTLGEEVVPGEIRTYSVTVGNKYLGAPAEDCEFLLEKLCAWINNVTEWNGLGEDKKVAAGILKAIIAHLYFAWIHPFGDGNGRTARLIELKILLDNGIPAAAAHLLSNFYNETRNKYYAILEKTSKGDGDPHCFLEYALQGFVDALDVHINTILKEQINVAWINYVYDYFRKNFPSRVGSRRRDLLLEISRIATMDDELESVTKNEIQSKIALNPSLLKKYADSQRMLQRDLNELVKIKLLIKNTEAKYQPAFSTILSSYMSPCINV